jgi:hypothetical protein
LPLDRERVSTTLHEILTREGIPEPAPNTWLQDWLTELFSVPPSTAEVIGNVALGLAVALLLAALVLVVLRVRRRDLAPGEVDQRDESAPEEFRDHVAELRQRARRAEERGEWALALRLEFFALALGLGECGALDYREAWTNRELLERGHPRPAVRATLLPILGDLDAKTFGDAACGEADVRRFAELTDELLAQGGA